MKRFLKTLAIIIFGLVIATSIAGWWLYIYLECGKHAHYFC